MGVILPKEALEALGIDAKEEAKRTLVQHVDGRIELHHVDEKFARKLALLRDTAKRYKNALRELAK